MEEFLELLVLEFGDLEPILKGNNGEELVGFFL